MTTRNDAPQLTPTRLRRLAEIAGQIVVDDDLDSKATLLLVIEKTLDELCTADPRSFASVVADVVAEYLHPEGAA